MNLGTGLIPSPPDPRDYPIEQLLGSLGDTPSEALGLVPHVSIHSQGATSTCVWFGISQALRVFLKSRGLQEDFWASTRFGYYLTLVTQNLGISDSGCIPRVALRVLSESGFCKEEHWPWDAQGVLQKPLPDAYTWANDQKGKTTYYRLTGSGDELVTQLKSALSKGYPVIWGGPIDAAYETYTGTGTIVAPKAPFTGGHLRCLVGFTTGHVLEANSWSTRWGSSGFGFIDWSFIREAPSFGYEFWTFDYVPTVTG